MAATIANDGAGFEGAVDGVHGVVPVHARAKLLEMISATLQDFIAYKKGQGPKPYGAETVYPPIHCPYSAPA